MANCGNFPFYCMSNGSLDFPWYSELLFDVQMCQDVEICVKLNVTLKYHIIAHFQFLQTSDKICKVKLQFILKIVVVLNVLDLA